MGAQKGPNIKETQYYCEYVFFCIELPSWTTSSSATRALATGWARASASLPM